MADDVAVNTEIQVDDETRAALLLFNERVAASAKNERATKRVAKAERAKDEAAVVVRKLADDSNASAEKKAEAESAYKAAVDSYNAIKADPHAGDDRPKKAAPVAETTTDESASAEKAESPSETSSDEETSAQAVETAAESE